MSYRRLSGEALAAIQRANDTDTVIDHATARSVARAYSWSWASCWFEDTGNFAFPHEFNHVADRAPHEYMDHCLFGWWWDDHHAPTDSQVRTAMWSYLEERHLADGGVDVAGWMDLARI